MKVGFLYDGPHPAHAAWAKSLNAEFISNALGSGLKIPTISRLLKTLTVLREIPGNIAVLLCESGAEIFPGALWKIRNPDKTLVLIVDDPKFFLLPKMNFIKRKAYTWALSNYDMLLPTSSFMKRRIPSNLQDRCRVIPLYVEEHYRSSRRTNLNSKNVVFVGRVGREKGVDRIIRAFKILKKRFPDASLFVVGDGPLKRELVKQNKDIMWIGEVKDPKEYLMKGSIYMNLARVEPFGIAILEAMHLGLVPIISQNIGVAEIIKNVSSDLIVDTEEEAAEITRKLWESPDLHRTYSDKCRYLAREFTKEKSINGFKEAVASLIAGEK